MFYINIKACIELYNLPLKNSNIRALPLGSIVQDHVRPKKSAGSGYKWSEDLTIALYSSV